MRKALALLALTAVSLVIAGGCACNPDTWFVDDDLALQRFKEQAGTDDVIIVRDNHGFTGNDSDVTYELLIDGRPSTGRCTNSTDKPQICRLYNFGAE